MILLDTNVVSEVMKAQSADQRVIDFLADLELTPAITVITRMEILAGILALPEGQRRADLFRGAEEILSRADLLSFDRDCADACAGIMTLRRRSGKPIPAMDAMIAATALVHRATLVTRNTRDFEGVGVELINPWTIG